MILEINGRLEIGRKFFSSLGSRLGFLRRGKTTALLKAWGNKPELREEFISAVSEGRRQSSISSRSGVGMGSREQVSITIHTTFSPLSPSLFKPHQILYSAPLIDSHMDTPK